MNSTYNIQILPVAEIGIDEDLNEARGHILAMDVADLARSMEKDGLQQPIYVQESNKIPGKKYRCASGNRRLTAARVNKWTEIPCFIMDPKADELAIRAHNLKENLLRKELNIVQEAIGIKPFVVAHWTEESIAEEFAQSRGWVQVRKIVLGLPKDIQEELKAGLINQSMIRKLGSISDPKKQYEFLKQLKEHNFKGDALKLKPEAKPINPEARKERKPEQIFDMIEYLIKLTGKGTLTTRALAWAAGSISDIEFAESVREYCIEEGIDYEPHDAVASLVS